MKDQKAEDTPVDYSSWSNEQLIQRVLNLESKLRDHVQSAAAEPPLKKLKTAKPFDPSKYASRVIALKFAYIGTGFNGFEHHTGNLTPLPTIEEELWKALVRTRLISPPSLPSNGLDRDMTKLDTYSPGSLPVDWEGCEYSKCGRTDKGVSAFGQVIALKVRSARKRRRVVQVDYAAHQIENSSESWEFDPEDGFNDRTDELDYVRLLNNVLPPTIRILASCLDLPDNFDARFSCKSRTYRYFFTKPAYLPVSSSSYDGATSGILDIDKMREAAAYLVGTHDFRNMCKVDASKQLTEFRRLITSATVHAVEDGIEPDKTGLKYPQKATSDVYYFQFVGSAFLWHQVRNMVALLFLVGQGFEEPTLVRDLLDVEKYPRRPTYEMASDQPLVLWECNFSTTAGKFVPGHDVEKPSWDRGTGDDELTWHHGNSSPAPNGSTSRSGIKESLWQTWHSAKMDEVLARELMRKCTSQMQKLDRSTTSVPIYQGGNGSVSVGKYVLFRNRNLLEEPHILNARWAERKGRQPRQPRSNATEGFVQEVTKSGDSV